MGAVLPISAIQCSTVTWRWLSRG